MTREEALEELDTLLVPRDGEQDKLADAFEMAIQALENEPCKGCVKELSKLMKDTKATYAGRPNELEAWRRGIDDAIDVILIDRNIEMPKPCEDWCDVPSDEMTLEQARQAVKDLRKKLAEYLMKETCEDCISRQAVLDQTYLWSKAEFLRVTNPFDYLRERINSLPPVTPQPKTGKWVDIMVGDTPAQLCNRCNTFFPLAYTGGGHHYCPNCGAKMEVQENV